MVTQNSTFLIGYGAQCTLLLTRWRVATTVAEPVLNLCVTLLLKMFAGNGLGKLYVAVLEVMGMLYL